MTVWLSQVPTWVAFVVTVGIANLVAIGLMLIVRRWSNKTGVTAGPAVVNSWATSAGALCAVLFAFSIVTLWNGTSSARSNVDDEAAAIRLVGRDIAPSQVPQLRTYIDETIAEWPQLCDGMQDLRVDATLVALERSAKPRAPAYADDLYRQLGLMEDMRNRRWQTSTSSVPDEIWVALVVLACALLTVLAIALPDRHDMHLALMIAVATALGTLFWVAILLEYPFCGRHPIGPGDILSLARVHGL